MFRPVMKKKSIFRHARLPAALAGILRITRAQPRRRLAMMAGVCVAALSTLLFTPDAPRQATPISSMVIATASYGLSANDAQLAQTIFTAQRRGDFDWADALMAQMEDQILFGHFLAQRYLSAHYNTTKTELTTWLANFADQPEAPRIRALAQRKGASKAELAGLPEIASASLKGDGYVEHLGRRSMPDGFYRGLAHWKERGYGPAYRAFADVARQEKLNRWQYSAAHYWAYRAAKKLNDDASAYAHLQQAGTAPLTFYGQLANQQLGNRSAVMAASPSVPSELRAQPAVLRAQALAQAGQPELAEETLRLLVMQLDTHERPAVLALAGEFGLANLQVRLGSLEGLSTEEQYFARYPMPPWFTARNESVDSALLLAIARQESVFRGDAKSHMGATGMMQMLPSTAKHVERRLSAESIALASNGGNLPLHKQLDDPSVNIHLGAEYLSILSHEKAVQQDLIRLIAAYNAGPGSVKNWQTAARHIDDPLLYIESIPYPETRNYVMQVMAHRWVYQTLMGEDAPSLSALAQGQWPKLVARS